MENAYWILKQSIIEKLIKWRDNSCVRGQKYKFITPTFLGEKK